VIERPELFGAALLDAGAYDMARFDRFGLGASWTPELGSPERPADLRALMAYSPLHNVRSGARYPAMLVSDGEHDDVVTPVHAFKFAAALQAATNGSAPELLRLDVDTGFGPGASLSQSIALASDQLAFLTAVLPPPR
jgi:prolyl oligopeptidase